MCHDAAVLTAAVRSLYVHSYVLAVCGYLYLSGDVVAELFLQSPTPSAPLSNASILRQSDKLTSGNDPNISNTVNGLVMMATNTTQLAANHKHTLVTIFAVIGKSCSSWDWVISTSHQFLDIHLGQASACVVAVGIVLTIDDQAVQHSIKASIKLVYELISLAWFYVCADVVVGIEAGTCGLDALAYGITYGH